MPDQTTPNYGFVLPELSGSPTTWGKKVNDNLTLIDGLIKSNANVANAGQIQIGMVIDYFMPGLPPGYLYCDGSSHNVSDYPILGNVLKIGTATTFNTPDYRDKSGIGAGGLYVVGSYGGSATVTLDMTMIPSHAHPGSVAAAHTHPGSYQDVHTHYVYQDVHAHTVGNTQAHSHVIVTGNHNRSIHTGNHAHNYQQWVTGQGGPGVGSSNVAYFQNTVTANTSTAGDLGGYADTTGNLGGYTDTQALAVGNTDNRQPAVYADNRQPAVYVASQAPGVTVAPQGSGAAHSNMPPFIACNKIIRAA